MLKLTNVKKAFGGVVATDDLSIDFAQGSLSAIIGPNGAGKTTLFNLIAGKIKPDSGSIVFNGEEIAGRPATEIVRKGRSEEHTSELQSLMRISYAVFCLKKK